MAKHRPRKQIDHSSTVPNSKVQKLLRRDARRTQQERREIADFTAQRMKQHAEKQDLEDQKIASFKLSDEDYAKVVANNTALKEKTNYGPSGSKQKAMRRSNIIYVIHSTITGEVQEIRFVDRMAAHQYFIGCRFEVIRYPEFSAITHGYKDSELNPDKNRKAAIEEAEAANDIDDMVKASKNGSIQEIELEVE